VAAKSLFRIQNSGLLMLKPPYTLLVYGPDGRTPPKFIHLHVLAARDEAVAYKAALPVVLAHLRYMYSEQFRECVKGSGKPFGDPAIHTVNVLALLAGRKDEEASEEDSSEEVGLESLGGVVQVVEMLKKHEVIQYWCG